MKLCESWDCELPLQRSGQLSPRFPSCQLCWPPSTPPPLPRDVLASSSRRGRSMSGCLPPRKGSGSSMPVLLRHVLEGTLCAPSNSSLTPTWLVGGGWMSNATLYNWWNPPGCGSFVETFFFKASLLCRNRNTKNIRIKKLRVFFLKKEQRVRSPTFLPICCGICFAFRTIDCCSHIGPDYCVCKAGWKLFFWEALFALVILILGVGEVQSPPPREESKIQIQKPPKIQKNNFHSQAWGLCGGEEKEKIVGISLQTFLMNCRNIFVLLETCCFRQFSPFGPKL